MVSKYKKSGWFKESDRHRLARLGIKTGRKLASTGIGMSKFNLAKMSEAELKEKMQGLYDDAKKLIEGGATPGFHLGPEVGPQVTFMVKNKEDYEKYDVDEDYPFISAQATGISLDQWSEATGVDRDDINIMFLSINGPVTDLHNASVSLLDADSSEWDAYADDDWGNVNSMDTDVKKIKKGYENDELEVIGDQDPHADWYYSWGNKSLEERYKLAKELVKEWREADMERRGQKKVTDFAKGWKKTKSGDMEYKSFNKNKTISIEKYSDDTADIVLYTQKKDKIPFKVLREDVPVGKAKKVANDYIKNIRKVKSK